MEKLKEVPLDISDVELGKLARLAHERGMTIEGYINSILSNEIIKQQGFIIKKLKRAIIFGLVCDVIVLILGIIRKKK